jgi:hypothetical protein
MLSFLSTKLRFLLLLVLIILGVSFIFFDTNTQGPSSADPRIAKIEGQSIKRSDFEAAVRDTTILYTLQTGRRAEPSMEPIFRSQTWNRLVIVAAAKEAGLQASPAEAVQYIKTHPLFLDEQKKYNPSTFQFFSNEFLKPQGVNEERFQLLIQNQIVFDAMLKTISNNAVIRPAEVEEAYAALYGQASLKQVELPEAPIRASLKPGEEELQKFYQQEIARFNSPELRKLDYVLFTLKPEQLKLPEDKKKAALKELTQQAFQFTEPFFDSSTGAKAPPFRQAVEQAGLSWQSTPWLNQQEPLLGGKTPSLELTKLAFTLSPEAPVSDYQKIENGFIVLHLVETQAASPLPFAKVRSEVEQLYLTQKLNELIEIKGKKLARDLQDSLASGKSWEQAVADQGLKPLTLPTFSPAKSSDLKVSQPDAVRFWAQRLKVGAVSEFSRTSTGGMVLYLADRKVSEDPNQPQALEGLSAQLQQQRRYQILEEWISARMKKTGTNIPPDLLGGAYGQSL